MTISHVAVLCRSSAVVRSMQSTLNTFMWLPCGVGKHGTTTVAAVVVCASYLRVPSSLYYCIIPSIINSACSVSVYPFVLVESNRSVFVLLLRCCHLCRASTWPACPGVCKVAHASSCAHDLEPHEFYACVCRDCTAISGGWRILLFGTSVYYRTLIP